LKLNNIPKIIGHRGAAGLAPENTLSSIKKAYKSGLVFIEIDVKVTKDNIPILLHDDTIDRTTNKLGKCSNYNFDELSNLDAGSWFNKKYKNEKILSLVDCIKFANKKKIGLNIELKPNRGKEIDNVIAIKKILKKFKIKSNSFFSSFDINSIQYLKKEIPNIKRSFLVGEKNTKSLSKILNICKKYDCFSLGLDKKIIDEKVVSYFKKNKLFLTVYTVNNVNTAKKIFKMGVDSIFTDRPDKFKFLF